MCDDVTCSTGSESGDRAERNGGVVLTDPGWPGRTVESVPRARSNRCDHFPWDTNQSILHYHHHHYRVSTKRGYRAQILRSGSASLTDRALLGPATNIKSGLLACFSGHTNCSPTSSWSDIKNQLEEHFTEAELVISCQRTVRSVTWTGLSSDGIGQSFTDILCWICPENEILPSFLLWRFQTSSK